MITNVIIKRGTLYYKIWIVRDKASRAELSSFYQFKSRIENIKIYNGLSVKDIKKELKKFDYINVDKIVDNSEFFINRAIFENLYCYR